MVTVAVTCGYGLKSPSPAFPVILFVSAVVVGSSVTFGGKSRTGGYKPQAILSKRGGFQVALVNLAGESSILFIPFIYLHRRFL